MVVLNKDSADAVVQLVLKHYENLPKTGKPTDCEWTIAAAIVEVVEDKFSVVAFGTGSKCIGRNFLTPDGCVLHDGHAEVVARRGFLIYLLSELENWAKLGESRVFCGEHLGRAIVKDCLRYWFVTSVVPCGDASIMPMRENETFFISKKRKHGYFKEGKKICLDDVHRTGAKCLPVAGEQDEKLPGVDFHKTGLVRTKPGRGDPTASVSCSDKLARWNAVGLQGALLSLLINKEIHLEALIVTGETHFNEATLERAINSRIGKPNKLKFIQSGVNFPTNRCETRFRPSPCSVSWNFSTQRVEVCIAGRRLGTSKSKPGHFLEITKKSLHQRFLNLIPLFTKLPDALSKTDLSLLTYRELKNLAADHQQSWGVVKNDLFRYWTNKPKFIETFYPDKK